MTFAALWRELEPFGRDQGTGGYRRYSWTPADAGCRAWFTRQAENLGLTVEQDRNGNLWAWWGSRRSGAIVTGSHLDSVPDGGGYDGALGVASALAAVAELKARDFDPERAMAIAVFTEEEGARFRVPCLGSRLITGTIAPQAARDLSDDNGVTLAAAMTAAGADPGLLGPDEDLLGRIGAFVELHVEQGRALAPLDAAVGIAEGIWPHGRWRLDFQGRADHAGTARLADRKDPMLPYARTVLAARRAAADNGALATIGKVIAEPGGANGVSSAVAAWLDARAPDEARLEKTVTTVRSASMGYSAERAAGVVHPAGPFRPGAAGPDRGRARRGRDHGAGAPHRRRARRRGPRRPGPGRHAVRPQPDRRLALARRARRPARLRNRRACPRPGSRGPGGPSVTRRRCR